MTTRFGEGADAVVSGEAEGLRETVIEDTQAGKLPLTRLNSAEA